MLATSLFLMAGTLQAQDIALGLLDNFNDDTTQGWSHGLDSPNPPTVIPLGGPDGSQYLENLSTGDPGAGGKHVVWNIDPRWTGDYIAAGVNKIRVNFANFGLEPLQMRVAITRFDFACYVSTVPFEVPADATWRNYEFLLDATTMTDVDSSPFDFEDIASDVNEIRILSASTPSCRGDQVFAISGIDDIQTDADTDLDGINNSIDNCTLVANPRQCIEDLSFDNQADCNLAGFTWGQPDTDGDLYGNQCDADIAPQPGPFPSGDCTVNFLDLNAIKASFFASAGSPTYNADADLVYDGSVNFLDLNVMKAQFFSTPGPGLGNCGCAPDPSDLEPGENFAGEEMFVRGGLVLDWGAVSGINSLSNLGDGAYQARFSITAGSYGYKVAASGWSPEYANDVDATVVNGPAIVMGPGGGVGNSPIDIPETGCYEFDVVVTDGDLMTPASELSISVTGPLP